MNHKSNHRLSYRVFAIETSCDDTSLAVVSYHNDRISVDNMQSLSQIVHHQTYGGVVPEVASRLHAEHILSLVESMGVKDRSQISHIAVTTHPGLPGSLIVGKTLAYMLSERYHIPVLPVNHIDGHLSSLWLDRSFGSIVFPLVVLTASGGHNDIFVIDTKPPHDDARQRGPRWISRVGWTIDDAGGECFDKVSRMLGGPYPGGGWIAERAKEAILPTDIFFKRVFCDRDDLLFSFSGMKSQVYNYINHHGPLDTVDRDRIAWAFQEAMVDILATKLCRASDRYNAQMIGLVGGVSANVRLRERICELTSKPFLVPETFAYCTDNAGMIGSAGIIGLLG